MTAEEQIIAVAEWASRVLQLSEECTKLYKAALAERNAEQFDAYYVERRRKSDELIHLLEARPRLTP